MRTRRRWGWLLGLALIAAGMGAACSSAKSTPAGALTAACNEDPFKCAAGQTCWAAECVCPMGQACDLSNCVPRLACLPSAPGKKLQDPCQNTVSTPTCSDGQKCVEFAAGKGGCLAYCDAVHPCQDGETCVALKEGLTPDAPAFRICAPAGVDASAPPDEDAGPKDAAIPSHKDALPQ